MISRQFSKIKNEKIPKFPVYDIDPHGQFMCIYMKNSKTIQIVKSFRWKASTLDMIIKYQEQSRYLPKMQLESDCVIPQKLLYENHDITKIVIGRMHDHSQRICVSNFFSVKVFRIQFGKDYLRQFKIFPEGQIKDANQIPVVGFKPCRNLVNVSFYDRRSEVYSKNDRNIWHPDRNTVIFKDESQRLTIIQEQSSSQTMTYFVQRHGQIDKKLNIEKETNSKRKHTIPLMNESLCYMKNVHLWNQAYRESYFQPISSVVYVTSSNVLCQAKWNKRIRQYEIREIFNWPDDGKWFQALACTRYYLQSSKYIMAYHQRETYSILSLRFGWDQIFVDERRIKINPWIEEILINVLSEIYINDSAKIAEPIFKQLFENYEFILALFWPYQFTGQNVSTLQLEMILCKREVQDQISEKWTEFQNQKKNQIQSQQIWFRGEEKEKQYDQGKWTRQKNYKEKFPNFGYWDDWPEQTVKHRRKLRTKQKRFNLCSIKLHDHPYLLRWISPTEFAYVSNKGEDIGKLQYLKIEESFLFQVVRDVLYSVPFQTLLENAHKDKFKEKHKILKDLEKELGLN